MLTIDDCNSIIEKWGKSGFWYMIDCSNFDISSLSVGERLSFTQDSFQINFYLPSTTMQVSLNITGNNYATHIIYLEYSDGSIPSITITHDDGGVHFTTTKESFEENPFNFKIYLTTNPTTIPEGNLPYLVGSLFIPLSPLQIPVINGEFDNKLYIKDIGTRDFSYTIDGVRVTIGEDEKGKYFTLPSANDCVIGTKYSSRSFPLFNVSFREFKTIPTMSIPTLYKGTSQQVQLYNEDTEEYITEFQAYYKGELLTDNKITLPYDADDYIDITVDLLDNRYPNSTLKLKAPTMMYIANSQSDVENAISQGITTLQVGDTETEVLLNGIELTNVQLVNSHIQLNNCTLTDCQLIQSTYTDNGANNISNTNFNECKITTTQVSTYNNCTIAECTILNSELYITGTLQDNTFTNSLIVSDGEITLTNNTFTGIGSKTYFPSHLYLTGDYTLQNNTFNLTGTFTELSFNMCLIKATTDFNVGDFINKNTFNLNIEYETEPTSTLYYNIVDDDKIRARRI